MIEMYHGLLNKEESGKNGLPWNVIWSWTLKTLFFPNFTCTYTNDNDNDN